MESRPFASLTAGLLARKGAARPAMRRPHSGSFPVPTLPVSVQDDLGWNDMGEDYEDLPPVVAKPLSIVGTQQETAVTMPQASVPVPAPIEQQVMLEKAFSAPAAAALSPMPVVEEAKAPSVPALTPAPKKARVKKDVSQAKGASRPVGQSENAAIKAVRPRQTRAAFTLRLDPDRHLRLRLACVLSGRSAQQIVTDALEALLAKESRLDALVGQLPALQTEKEAAPRKRKAK